MVFNNWKLLGEKKLKNVDSKLAFPLLRWSSGNVNNLDECARINSLFFKIPNTLTISLLYCHCKTGYFKYPKAVKVDESSYDEIVRKYIMQLYNWGNSEYKKNSDIIKSMDKKTLGELFNKNFGLDKKECKIFGIDYNAKKYKFEDKPKMKGLDMFM